MTPAAMLFKNTEHLFEVAERLRGVQLECDDAFAVIGRYDSPETLFYLDPPYPSSTRGRWKSTAYAVEMSDEDHRDLAGLLSTLEGMVILSGYDCPLYRELFGGWKRIERTSRINGSGQAQESLWISSKSEGRWKWGLPLFAGLGGGDGDSV